MGAAGLNIMAFCKDFNARTKEQAGTILPIIIEVYADRTYNIVIKSPPAAVLLREKAKIAKGSGEPNKKKVGTVTRADIEDIAKTKMNDLNAKDMEMACRMIEGTARSSGILVEG